MNLHQPAIYKRLAIAMPRVRWGKVRTAATGYLLIAPALAIFVVYYVYAIVRSLYLSFTDYKLLAPTSVFVGFRNYTEALQDHIAINGFGRAGYYMVLFYIGAFILPLVIALLTDRVTHPRLSAIYRTLLFLPAAVPGPLVYRLWRWMYLPSFGLINYILVDKLHLLKTGPLWLVGPGLEMPSIVFMTWWQVLGISTIFFLAGLDAISPDLYEAARLDGAGELQIVRYITLPCLRNTLVVWTILRIGAFGMLEPVLAMFSFTGAPQSLWTWAYYAWFQAFRVGKLPIGYASAIGWLGAIVMIALALLARWAFREKTKSVS